MNIRNLLAKGIVVGAAVATLTGIGTSYVWADDAAKAMYEDKCAGCHGPGGKGDGPAGAMLDPKPKDFATVLKGQDDAAIKKIIKEGGAAAGKSASMPPSSDLSDDQIKALVDYIKHL